MKRAEEYVLCLSWPDWRNMSSASCRESPQSSSRNVAPQPGLLCRQQRQASHLECLCPLRMRHFPNSRQQWPHARCFTAEGRRPQLNVNAHQRAGHGPEAGETLPCAEALLWMTTPCAQYWAEAWPRCWRYRSESELLDHQRHKVGGADPHPCAVERNFGGCRTLESFQRQAGQRQSGQ